MRRLFCVEMKRPACKSLFERLTGRSSIGYGFLWPDVKLQTYRGGQQALRGLTVFEDKHLVFSLGVNRQVWTEVVVGLYGNGEVERIPVAVLADVFYIGMAVDGEVMVCLRDSLLLVGPDALFLRLGMDVADTYAREEMDGDMLLGRPTVRPIVIGMELQLEETRIMPVVHTGRAGVQSGEIAVDFVVGDGRGLIYNVRVVPFHTHVAHFAA